GGLRRPGEGGVQLGEEDPQRAAVADGVVQAEHEHVVVRGEPDQQRPRERRPVEGERPGHEGVADPVRLVLAGDLGAFEVHVGLVGHDLDGAAVVGAGQAGAQRLVPGGQAVQGVADAGGVERPADPVRAPDLVAGRVLPGLVQEPEPFLCGCQREAGGGHGLAARSRRCPGTWSPNSLWYAVLCWSSETRKGRSVGTMCLITSIGTGLRSGRKSGFHSPALSGGPSWNSPIIRPWITYAFLSSRCAASITSRAWRMPGSSTRMVAHWEPEAPRGARSRNHSR